MNEYKQERKPLEGWYIRLVPTIRIWTAYKNIKDQYVPAIFDTCAIAQQHIDRHTNDRERREKDLCRRLDWSEYEPIEIKTYIKKYGVVAGQGFVR